MPTLPVADTDQNAAPQDAPVAAAPAAYRVERILRVTHALDYQYPRPVRDVRTRLRLVPPPERGAAGQEQRLLDEKFRFAPLPARRQQARDPLGNVIHEVTHEVVQAHLTIVAELAVATRAAYGADGYLIPVPLPCAPGEDPDAFRAPTPLTAPDELIVQ